MNGIDLEKALSELPDQVAASLQEWRVATLTRQKVDALLYAKFKLNDEKRTATDLKYLVSADEDHFKATLEEIEKESAYTRVYERLLSIKKAASLRVAF